MNLRCFILTALTWIALSGLHVCADVPSFTKEAQGDWYVLAAHQNNKNIAAGKDTGSRVSITADRIVWRNSEKPDLPLLDAMCQRAKVVDTPKTKPDPNELTSTVRGSLCPKQDAKLSARWQITPDNGVLLALVQVAEFKGYRNGTFSGAAPADVLLICQRKPLPAMLPPDPVKDSKRLIGKWAVLGELDDANCARTRPQGNVEFTTGEFFKRGSLAATAKPGQQGTWKLLSPQGERGRLDLIFKTGIELNQGRSPGLYAFYGDDLLMIVYPEGGWAKDAVEKQELRTPPSHFGSDGSRNMWILRRLPVEP